MSPATSRKGNRCVVHQCRQVATHWCPLDHDDELDLHICKHHYKQMVREPSAWIVTCYPSASQPANRDRDMTVIVPKGTELGKAKR